MASKRATSIADYIQAAHPQAQPHLRKLYALLKRVAPEAQEAIKWGNPFFVEPRFLFAFSAHKAHVSFAPMASAMEAFKQELARYQTTTNMLKVRYDEPLPEELIGRIAGYCVKAVKERGDGGFW